MERESSHTEKHIVLSVSESVYEISKHLRDKAATMSAIIDVARRIIFKEGIRALKINRLARESNRSKSLIYAYFLNLDGVLKMVLTNYDPWLQYKVEFSDLLKKNEFDFGETLSNQFLKNHFIQFKDAEFAQLVARDELSQNGHPVIKEISLQREKLATRFFKISDPHFRETDVDIRQIFALLIGGINYLSLHKSSLGITFCEIDIHKQQDEITHTLGQILKWAYKAASESKQLVKGLFIISNLLIL